MQFKTMLALATSVVLWASAFVGIRAAVEEYSPEGLALLRYIIAGGCLAGAYGFRLRRNSILWSDKCAMLLTGVFGIGGYNLALNYGERVVSAGMASFVVSQAPILTAIIASIFFNERFTFRRALGFGFSVLAVSLITLADHDRASFSANLNSGLAYVLIATIISSLYSFLQKPFLQKYTALEVTTHVIWGGALFLMLYWGHLQHDVSQASTALTLVVVYLGVFPAAVGYLTWNYALLNTSPSQAMSFLYFTPFVSTLIAWLWLGETPTILFLIGGVFALSGVWLVNRAKPLANQLRVARS